MKHDLDKLGTAFVHHTDIIKMVTRLKKALANAKKDELNKHFWAHTAKTLQKDHIKRQERQTVMDTAILGIQYACWNSTPNNWNHRRLPSNGLLKHP
ncbi:hypothetical protein DFQ28_006542, partial [Apophysomyces sp. BC1034]